MSDITQNGETTNEDAPGGAVPSFVQHNMQLHSALYHMLHSVCPKYPGEPPEPAPPVSLVTNGLGCLPITAEDGKYIVKND